MSSVCLRMSKSEVSQRRVLKDGIRQSRLGRQPPLQQPHDDDEDNVRQLAERAAIHA